MKINKLPRKKTIIILASIFLVAACGYGAYAMSAQKWPFAKDKQQTSSTADTSAGSTNPTAANTPSQAPAPQEDQSSSPKTPTANEPTEDTEPKDTVGVTITAVTPNGNALRISNLIEAVTNQGTCTLTLEKAGQTVTKTSGIQALPHSSTCKGFTIPLSELSAGTWHIKLSVVTSGKSGSASQDYKVQ